jgi:hypothetical protein
MSNHYHCVNTDESGDRSDFMRDLNALLARARNRQLRRKGGHFWGPGRFGDAVLLDKDAVIEKLLYCWLNAVEAGLVSKVSAWPGFKILPKHWGVELTFERPHGFFRKDQEDRLPKSVTFTPQPPPGFEDMELEEVRKLFEDAIRQRERDYAKLRRVQGRKVLGPAKARRVDPLSRPKTPTATGRLNPRFASKDAATLQAAKGRHYEFLRSYSAAREAYRAGDRDAEFPAGTIWFARQLGVRCACVDPSEPGLARAPD